jgi:hypothetical protein
MADLTADAPLRIKGEAKTEFFTIDTAASRTIYKGQPVMIDQDVDTTNIVQYIDSVHCVATDVGIGIAAEQKSVVSGDAETTVIEVYVAPTIVGFKSTVFTTNASLGSTICFSDSSTLSLTETDNVRVGKLFKVEDGYCYVQLTTPQICTGTG